MNLCNLKTKKFDRKFTNLFSIYQLYMLLILVRWLHKSANSILWKFQASSWIFQPMLPKCSFYFMNLLNQFMVLLNQLDMWHNPISWQWTFTSSMNLPNKFHNFFCTLCMYVCTSLHFTLCMFFARCSLVPLYYYMCM